MNKKSLWALVLIALVVVVLVLNRGDVEVHVLFGAFEWTKSLVFLGFTAVGVVIGMLFR